LVRLTRLDNGRYFDFGGKEKRGYLFDDVTVYGPFIPE
jgi:hypothetical protein